MTCTWDIICFMLFPPIVSVICHPNIYDPTLKYLLGKTCFHSYFYQGFFFFFWPQSSLHTSVIQYFFFLVHTFCPKEVTQNFLLSCFSCPLFSPSPCNRYFYHFASRWLGFPSSSAGKESACNAGDPGLIPGLGRSSGEDRLPTPVFLGFPSGSTGKESACNAGDPGSIPGLGRTPGEGKATHCSILAWSIPGTV